MSLIFILLLSASLSIACFITSVIVSLSSSPEEPLTASLKIFQLFIILLRSSRFSAAFSVLFDSEFSEKILYFCVLSVHPARLKIPITVARIKHMIFLVFIINPAPVIPRVYFISYPDNGRISAAIF